MALNRYFKLNSGYSIPAVGLGTWQSKPLEVKNAVTAALKSGYRHIDAAAVYDNESEVGEGIRASQIDRKDIFVRQPQDPVHGHQPHQFTDYKQALEHAPQAGGCRKGARYYFKKPSDRLSRFVLSMNCADTT